MLLLLLPGCRNATLFEDCVSDADCDGGLVCLETVDWTFSTPDSGLPRVRICTRTCETAHDCPVEAGCAGPGDERRADCIDGVCSVKLCD